MLRCIAKTAPTHGSLYGKRSALGAAREAAYLKEAEKMPTGFQLFFFFFLSSLRLKLSTFLFACSGSSCQRAASFSPFRCEKQHRAKNREGQIPCLNIPKKARSDKVAPERLLSCMWKIKGEVHLGLLKGMPFVRAVSSPSCSQIPEFVENPRRTNCSEQWLLSELLVSWRCLRMPFSLNWTTSPNSCFLFCFLIVSTYSENDGTLCCQHQPKVGASFENRLYCHSSDFTPGQA